MRLTPRQSEMLRLLLEYGEARQYSHAALSCKWSVSSHSFANSVGAGLKGLGLIRLHPNKHERLLRKDYGRGPVTIGVRYIPTDKARELLPDVQERENAYHWDEIAFPPDQSALKPAPAPNALLNIRIDMAKLAEDARSHEIVRILRKLADEYVAAERVLSFVELTETNGNMIGTAETY